MHNAQIPLHDRPNLLSVAYATHGRDTLYDVFQMGHVWAIHFYEYHGQWVVNGQEFTISPGSVTITPSNSTVRYTYEKVSRHIYCHFTFKQSQKPTTEINPILLSPSRHTRNLHVEATTILDSFSHNPTRAEVKLWDVLWQIHELESKSNQGSQSPKKLTAILEHIERNLNIPLSVKTVADAHNISHNTLTNWFNTNLKVSPLAYINRRKAKHIAHLLTFTDLPIKSIAYEIGIRNLQQFNKLTRKELGLSPRAYRQKHSRTLRR